VRLSSRARAYLEDVRSCFDRLAIASEQLSAVAGSHIVRINTTPSFAMRWLIPRLSRFQVDNRRTEVRVSTSPFDTIDHLSDTYDIIIRRDRMVRAGHRCECFLEDVSAPVASPSLIEKMSLNDPSELKQEMLLHLKSRPDAWVHWFRTAGVSMPDTDSGPIFDHFFLSLQAAINGMGVALAPHALVEDDLEQGRLVQPFNSVTIRGPGFHCLYREGGLRDRQIVPVLEWLVREGKEASPTGQLDKRR